MGATFDGVARPDASAVAGNGAGPSPSGPGGAITPEPNVPTSKVAAVQGQVDQVKGTMATNIELLIDRGERLSDLDTKAEGLGERSKQFKSSATSVQKKMRWQKWKWRLICLLILLVLCSGLITTLVVLLKN